MQCTSCSEEIPADSIFCPECGSRQDLSRANFGSDSSTLGGDESSGIRTHGVVSSEAIAFERESRQNVETNLPSGLVTEIASNLAQQDQQEMQSSITTDDTTDYSANDAMVDRINTAEKSIKSERRNVWLEMNKATASSVLSQINSDLPSHLKNEDKSAASNIASQFLQSTVGEEGEGSSSTNIPEITLLRRMTEVAIRRIARKRGVAVESPQIQLIDDLAEINITFVDDGRVLDTPSDLAQAFNHAISTEIALKGFEISANLILFRSKDGEVEKVWGSGSGESEDEEMFACEACGALVKASDPKCQGCGAQFEDENSEPKGQPQGPPSKSNPSGPPGGPSRGGPPRGGGGPPGGPSRGGGPPRGGGGPPRGGPPRGGGGQQPGGPSRGGGPPGGPSRGGPPRGGPPRGEGGPPRKGPARGGPRGPKRS